MPMSQFWLKYSSSCKITLIFFPQPEECHWHSPSRKEKNKSFVQDHSVWVFKWRPMTLRYKPACKNLVSFRAQKWSPLPAVILKQVCLSLNAYALQPALGRNLQWKFHLNQEEEIWVLEYINAVIIIFPWLLCKKYSGKAIFSLCLC